MEKGTYKIYAGLGGGFGGANYITTEDNLTKDEAYLNDCDLEHFKTLSKEDQIEYLEEEGELIIDDYSVNDRGELYNIEVHE